MKPKTVIIGAGSAIFGLGTLATLVRSERLRGGTLALVDLNAEGLALIDALARRLRERITEIDPDSKLFETVRGYGFRLNLS